MRGRHAFLLVVAAFVGSGTAAALHASTRVGSHVWTELSCKALAAAESRKWIDRKQRNDVVDAVLKSGTLSSAAQQAASGLRNACR